MLRFFDIFFKKITPPSNLEKTLEMRRFPKAKFLLGQKEEKNDVKKKSSRKKEDLLYSVLSLDSGSKGGGRAVNLVCCWELF